jgi:hypothetical protein
MLKCSFCERPLVCKACKNPYRPTRPEAHAALYQPDMMVFCPECKALLVCRWCDYAYGEEEEEGGGETAT